MISLRLLTLFSVIVQSIPLRSIYFQDGSLIQGEFIIRIRNIHVSGRLLRFFSRIPLDAVQERLEDYFATGSYTEFGSEDLILLLPRIYSCKFSRHPVEAKVYIFKSTSQMVHNFTLKASFYKLIQSKRTESCALNYSKFVFTKGKCDSVDDLESGLSMPFKMTLGDLQRSNLKLGIDLLQKDLNEILVLLHRLKEDQFEGMADSAGFGEIIVLGIDSHLKLIVPAVVGSVISILIDQFDQFKLEMIEAFGQKAQIVEKNVPLDPSCQLIVDGNLFDWKDLDLENFEFCPGESRICPDANYFINQEALMPQECELIDSTLQPSFQNGLADCSLEFSFQNDKSDRFNLEYPSIPSISSPFSNVNFEGPLFSAAELFQELSNQKDSEELGDIYSLID